jgi:hypothetical protein
MHDSKPLTSQADTTYVYAENNQTHFMIVQCPKVIATNVLYLSDAAPLSQSVTRGYITRQDNGRLSTLGALAATHNAPTATAHKKNRMRRRNQSRRVE